MATWILSPRGAGDTCCACKALVTTPCTCPAPTLVCDSISASKTKCGFDEFGTPSSPPKKYLVKTQSGGLTQFVGAGTTQEDTYNTWSGSLTYARPACTTTDTRQVVVRAVRGSDVGGPCDTSETVTGTAGEADYYGSYGSQDNGHTFLGPSSGCDVTPPIGLDYCGTYGTVGSTTQKTFGGPSTCGGSSVSGGLVTVDLTDEYTNALLIADTEAALPSYPGTYSGTCSSYRDLSTDELTYTIRRFKYKFTLPTMPSGLTSYVIDWYEGATAKSYTWNGTDTETPVYGPVFEPGSNGTVAITGVTVTCT